MARGDHIRVFRGFYWHHGIDCGDGTVIHYTGTPTNMSNAQVKHEAFDVFADGGRVNTVRYSQAYPADETIKRAKSRLGEKKYNLAFNNCEHFACWCRCGENKSAQVETVAGVAVDPGRVVRSSGSAVGLDGLAGVAGMDGAGRAVDALKNLGDAVYDPDMADAAFLERVISRDVVRPYSGDGTQRELALGKNNSIHSRDPETGKTIPGGQLAKEADVLGLANLAVGVVNLGVGLYNAYKINSVEEKVISTAGATQAEVRRNRQAIEATRRDVGEVKRILVQGLGEVQNVLEYQNGVLQSIQQVQGIHDQKLDAIMYGLIEGFSTLEERIASVTATRREDEYYRFVSGLEMAKREAAEALAYNGGLSNTELGKLTARAEDLQIWLEGRLRDPQLHLLGRQPVMLALAEAKMTRIDALMFESPKNLARAQGRVGELRRDIVNEVRRLHDETTPWEVATAIHGQVETYATLHRALDRSAELLAEDEDERLEVSVDRWSSSLPETPARSEGIEDGAMIELKTIDDYEWFIRAFNVDRGSFDIHSLPALPASALAKRLGATELRVDPSQVRPFLLEDTWKRYQRTVESEFGFVPGTSLVDVGIEEIVGEVEQSNRDDDERRAEAKRLVPEGKPWNYRGSYQASNQFYIRASSSTAYRFDFDWADGQSCRLYFQTGRGRIQFALESLWSDESAGEVEFAEAEINAGVAVVRIRIPGTDDYPKLNLQSQRRSIYIDGEARPTQNIAQRAS